MPPEHGSEVLTRPYREAECGVVGGYPADGAPSETGSERAGTISFTGLLSEDQGTGRRDSPRFLLRPGAPGAVEVLPGERFSIVP